MDKELLEKVMGQVSEELGFNTESKCEHKCEEKNQLVVVKE